MHTCSHTCMVFSADNIISAQDETDLHKVHSLTAEPDSTIGALASVCVFTLFGIVSNQAHFKQVAGYIFVLFSHSHQLDY